MITIMSVLFTAFIGMAYLWDMWKVFAMIMIGLWMNNISNKVNDETHTNKH